MEVQNCTVISGCRSDERSYEYEDDQGVWHGTLTYFLAREIQSAGSAATYQDVMDNVQAKVSAVKPHQHPVLSGAQADNFVFGTAASQAKPFVLASPSAEGVILQAGQAQGVTAGSVYRIFRPGTKEFEDTKKAIATVEIVKVLPFRSDARLIEGKAIPTSSRAVEVQHQYGERLIGVYFDNPDKLPAATEIRRLVGSAERIEPANSLSPSFQEVFVVVEEPQKAQLFVRQDGTGAAPGVTILTGDGMALSSGIAAEGAGAARLTAEQLAKWAKWYRTLMIENEHPAFKVDLKIEPLNKRVGRGVGDEIGRPLQLVDGEKVRISVDNKSSEDIYVAVLDFSSDGSITMIYPPRGAGQPIRPSEGMPLILGESETMVPAGRELVRDYVKLFATRSPVDFGFLRQGAILGERGKSDPFTRLLAGSQLLARSRGERISTDQWTTRLKCVETTKMAK
jgi:hypothetical protein